MKIKKALTATGIFIFLLFLFYYIHSRFLFVDVVFYSAIVDSFLAVFIATVILFTFNYFSVFNFFEKMQMSIIWLLLGFSLVLAVPTIIDRSLSFYILEKLQQHGGGVKHKNIKDIFVTEYVEEHRLVDVRITEQLSSGTILVENDCVKLTNFGDNLATFGRFFRQNILPKRRLLMGQYTDDLTNPFRRGKKKFGYECQ